MTSQLLIAGTESAPEERWQLNDHDEEILSSVLRELAPYATPAEQAAVVHERDGEVISAWDRDGALRLAQALQPAYGELAETLVRGQESSSG